MMMTKPAPTATAAVPPKTAASSGNDPVKNLEQRLQNLETTAPATPAPATMAAAPAAPPKAAPAMSGKNALLARIMAAQERAKQGPAAAASTTATATATTAAPPPATAAAAPTTTTAKAAVPPTTDLLDSFDTPAESAAAPPPPSDVSLLPQAAPPAPDAASSAPPSTAQPAAAAPPAASGAAPVIDDLLDSSSDQKMAPSATMAQNGAPAPTSSESTPGGMDQEAIDAILGIEGLSDEEKAALIAEQEKIMASIEQEKKNKAPQSAADAFEQRSTAAAIQAIGGGSSIKSTPANTAAPTTTAAATPQTTATPQTVDLGDGQQVALHGQTKTYEAIKKGTAVLVQCLSCENWMQVTGKATMMFCPICQTVSPVAVAEEKPKETSTTTSQHLASDMQLAEQLQQEEYKKAEKRQARIAQQKRQQQATQAAASAEGGSWMEWLGFGAAPETAATTTRTTPSAQPPSPDRSFAQRPLERGEIGVSLPPGASRNNTALAMAPAYTGRDDDVDVGGRGIAPAVSYSSSRDSGDEDAALMNSGGGGGARVAEQQPILACVADSISLAATQLYNTVAADGTGNVHGVDSSGLLGGRRESNNNNNPGGGGYANMNN